MLDFSRYKKISFKGFVYFWDEDSFLSINQAEYALERLWFLSAGFSSWEGQPAIQFMSITTDKVFDMMNLKSGKLPWIDYSCFLPVGVDIGLDSKYLPELCKIVNNDPCYFDGTSFFPLDLIAATFILLSRWEEFEFPDPDEHMRHKEESTLCVRQEFLDRPVLDEWALILRQWLIKNQPSWASTMPDFKIWMTHDIDHIAYYKNFNRVLRGVMRGWWNQKSINQGIKNGMEGLKALLDVRNDPCVKNIDLLLDLDESIEAQGTFFFMCSKPGKYDDGYDLMSKMSQTLMKTILSRGHNIAWHPGYDAALDDNLYKQELKNFQQSTKLSEFGVRHHFLRWNVNHSWRRMENNYIQYDSSLGYSKLLGFRASTSHPFPVFDLQTNQALCLEEKPLIIMDQPLLKDCNSVQSNVQRLMNRCKVVNGCFSLLLHNYTLMVNPDAIPRIKKAIDISGK